MITQVPAEWINQLKTQYREIIQAKSARNQKQNAINWGTAEMNLLDKMDGTNQLLWKAILEYQKVCQKDSIQQFCSYFVVDSLLKSIQTNRIEIITKITQEMHSKKYIYFGIMKLIDLRENCLKKIAKYTNKDKINSVFENIDNIRIINLEVIFKIHQWKQQIQNISNSSPIFYFNQVNYLTKMLTDNVQIINSIKFQKTKFISPPNPFFLTEDGNIQSMSQKQKAQIDQCMDILKEEKLEQIKMMIQTPQYLKTIKNETKNQQKKQIRNRKNSAASNTQIQSIKRELLSQKQEQIKNIYKINKSLSTKRQKNEILAKSKAREAFQIKLSDLKQPTKVKVKNDIAVSYSSMPPKSVVANARDEILSVSSSKITSKVPTKFQQIKTPKPKIRLVSEKNTLVEDVIQSTLEMIVPKNTAAAANDSRFLTRKPSSTFYKSIEVIKQQNEQGKADQIDIKPITLDNMSKSRKSVTLVNFNLKLNKSISPLKKKLQIFKNNQRHPSNVTPIVSKAIKEQPERNANQSLRIVNNRLKNLTIINIYKQKLMKGRKTQKSVEYENSEDGGHLQYSRLNASQVDLSRLEKREQRKYSSRVQKIKKLSTASLSKLDRKRNSLIQTQNNLHKGVEMKEKQKWKIIQELEKKRKSIQILEAKINSIQSKKKQDKISNSKHQQKLILQKHKIYAENEKRRKSIQNKVIKEKINVAKLNYVKSKEEEFQLKKKNMQLKFQNELKALQNQCKFLEQQNRIKFQQEQKKVKEKQIELLQEKLKIQQMKIELQEEELRQQLLNKILEEQMVKDAEIDESVEAENNLQLSKRQLLQIESKTIMMYEQQKMNLSLFYDEIKSQNRLLQQQNKRKLQELFLIQQQKAQQREKRNAIEKQLQLQKQSKNNKVQQSKVPEEKNEQDNLQQIRDKVCEQVLKEMLLKKQKQQEEERKYQQKREQRLKKIQKEIALILQEREAEMEKYENNLSNPTKEDPINNANQADLTHN